MNVGLSVSRVGGKTQPPVIKHLAGSLKLDYAQILELKVFTRFGAMAADRSISDKLDKMRVRERSLRQEAITAELLDVVIGAKAILDRA